MASVEALKVYKGELYAGGNFHYIDNTPVFQIARTYFPNVGIEEVSVNENEIIIYPNPTGDTFKILTGKLQIISYEILNSTGNVIFKDTFSSPASSFTFNLREHAGGVYFLKAYTKEGSVVRKIVKP